MDDHVHLLVNCPATLAPRNYVPELRGGQPDSDQEFQSIDENAWTRSYFVSTAGNVSGETI